MPKKKKEIKTRVPGYVTGRPTSYTKELGERICEAVSTNPVGYETICKMFDDFPCRDILYRWRLKYREFADNYLRAKAFQAEMMAEEVTEVTPATIKTYLDDKGNERIDAPSASLAIAKANSIKWQAARLAPKRFGDLANLDALKERNLELNKELEELRDQLDQKNKKEY